MSIIMVLFRTLLFYVVIAIVYRFMGKRELTSRKIMIDLLPKNFYLKRIKTKKEIKLIEKELS